jgi:tetratricopeptide (TPR) repeat protein
LSLCCTIFSFSVQGQTIQELKNLLDQEQDPAKKITHLQSIGNHYLERRIYFDSAFFYHDRSLNLAREQNDSVEQARSLFNLARIQNNSGRYAEAVNYYKSSLVLSEALKRKVAMSSTYNNLGGTYFHLKKFEKAISYYEKAEDLHVLNDDVQSLAIDAMNIGEAQYAMGDLSAAEINFKKSLAYISTLNWDPPTVHLYYARTLDALKRYEEAVFEANKAYVISQQQADILLEAESAELLAKIFAEKKEFQNAYTFQSKAVLLLDSLNLAKETNEIEKLKLNFKLKEQEEKLLHATKQNNYLTVIYVLVGLGVMLLVVLVFRQLKISRMTSYMHEIQTRLIEPELNKRKTTFKEATGFEAARKQDEELL